MMALIVIVIVKAKLIVIIINYFIKLQLPITVLAFHWLGLGHTWRPGPSLSSLVFLLVRVCIVTAMQLSVSWGSGFGPLLSTTYVSPVGDLIRRFLYFTTSMQTIYRFTIQSILKSLGVYLDQNISPSILT